MAITTYIYGSFVEKLSNKEIDYESDDIKLMLCDNNYTPNLTTDIYKNQVTNEVSGDGYTSGGELLTGKSITYDSGVTSYIASSLQWLNITTTFRYAVLYDDTGNDATSPLIAYFDFGDDVILEISTFTINFSSSEVITFTI